MAKVNQNVILMTALIILEPPVLAANRSAAVNFFGYQ